MYVSRSYPTIKANSDATVELNGSYETTISRTDPYRLKSVTVTMDEVDISNDVVTWESGKYGILTYNNATIKIPEVTGKLNISVVGSMMYSMSKKTSNCKTKNETSIGIIAGHVWDGDTYFCAYVPSSGYTSCNIKVYKGSDSTGEEVTNPLIISENTTVDETTIRNCTEVWGSSINSDYYTEDVSYADGCYTLKYDSALTNFKVKSNKRFSFVVPEANAKGCSVKMVQGENTFGPYKIYSGTDKDGNDVELDAGVMAAKKYYVIKCYKDADKNLRMQYLGQGQVHAMVILSDNPPTGDAYEQAKIDEACDVLRHYVVLKGKLMPYLWAQANKTHNVGVPMMRSMIVAFTGDTACKYLDQQYMLGDNLCVVPVMNEEGIAEFYVPDCGTWTDIQSGETYEGGRYYTRKCDYFQTPVLARPNSIVTFGNFDAEDKMNVVYDYLQDAEAVVYALEDGKTAEAVIYDSESNKITDITATRKGNVITVSYAATDKSFKVTAEGKTVEAAAGTTSVEITL